MIPRNVTRRLKGGSLFSGYGGLDLAVEAVLGTHLSWVSEIDAAPSRILAQQFPGVPNLGDITAVDWSAVEPVDVLTGGFPCQDLSTAGGRAGLREGTRSGLWYEMARAIDSLRPRLVIAENVRGLLSAEADSDVEPCSWCVGEAGDGEPPMRALVAVLADLAGLGYDAAWCGLRAADVGAPHGRFRVFVLAWDAAADTRSEAGKQWPGLRTDDTARHWRGLSTRSGRETDQISLLPTPVAGDAKSTRNSTAVRHHTPPTVVHAGDTLTDAVVPTRGLSRDFGQYAPAIDRWKAVLGRAAPAPTEPTGKGGAHRLSPRFVEWLMGLPDGWVTGEGVEAWRARLAERGAGMDSRPVGHRGSVERRTALVTRNEQLKALGNGVVPQQAATAIRHLLSVQAQALTAQQ